MNLQSKLQKRTIGLSKGPKTLLDSPWAIKLIIFLFMIMKMEADPINSGKVLSFLIQRQTTNIIAAKDLSNSIEFEASVN